MLEALKEAVFQANRRLVTEGLVTLTWGNASGIDRASGLFVIKPSGVGYDTMCAGDMVVVDLDGNVVEGRLKPSSDTPTHAYLYRAFAEIGGIVHTHSTCATAAAQAEHGIFCCGTTHADHFYGEVPCTRHLTAEEIAEGYERNTGKVIAETFRARGIDENAVPAVLVRKHGPFAWGTTPQKAVDNAVALEACAKMEILGQILDPEQAPAPQYLLDKHYFRKHGAGAYYGQR